MESATYELAAAAEDVHWWFRGRRAVLRAILRRFLPDAGARDRTILEIGCGNGGNLPLLSEFGRVFAIEKDDGARARARARHLAEVECGMLPDGVPFDGRLFDVVALLDVLEHIEDDRSAIATIRARLKPTGLLVVAVPAYQWLWSAHDEKAHHWRRYTSKTLRTLLTEAGYSLEYRTYFNTLLFPLAVTHIAAGRLLKTDSHTIGMQPPAQPINDVMAAIFSMEQLMVPVVSLPFGLSLLACARPIAR